MVFSSSVFLFCYLPITLLIYSILKDNYKNTFLTIASLFFYAWGEPVLVFVMLFLIVVNYTFGLLIYKYNSHKKILLLVCTSINLGFLIYYKYINFIIENLNKLLLNFQLEQISQTNILLPIGISFFTFQAMSYTIDVYRDKDKCQRKLVNVALYISLFPQLIAGPIVRYNDIEPQISDHPTTLDNAYKGIKRFIIGLAKKVFIANNVAIIADKSFGSTSLTTGVAWIGIITYTLQIYYDFSGYSDMAIGLGKIFGFDFPENFNMPYISKSIKEFWRRWHMTLSSWFRDYVYIPLGGNKRGNVRTYINLTLVFLLTGIWHGANWTFILWGIVHGLFLIFERIIENSNIRIKIPNLLKHIYTMLVVMVAWVLFRAPNIKYAASYLKNMFTFNFPNGLWDVLMIIDNETMTMILIGIIGVTGVHKLMQRNINLIYNRLNNLKLIEDMLVFIMFLILALKVITGAYNPFIYFQF